MNKEIERYSDELFEKVSSLIENSRNRIAVTANSELAYLYWITGKNVNEFILHNTRAPYGKKIIINLSKRLTAKYGKGWSAKHIRHCLRAAETIDVDAYQNPFV